jgi:hypothetical protein
MSSIGSTLNSINSSLLSEISQYSATKSASSGSTTQTSGSPSSDSIDLSQVSKLFKELSQLQSSDNSEFKKIASEAATKLKEAAKNSTDPAESRFLSDLAGKFQKAADSGDLSALQPPSHSGGSHRGYSSQASDSDNSTDLLSALTKYLSSSKSSDG